MATITITGALVKSGTAELKVKSADITGVRFEQDGKKLIFHVTNTTDIKLIGNKLKIKEQKCDPDSSCVWMEKASRSYLPDMKDNKWFSMLSSTETELFDDIRSIDDYPLGDIDKNRVLEFAIGINVGEDTNDYIYIHAKQEIISGGECQFQIFEASLVEDSQGKMFDMLRELFDTDSPAPDKVTLENEGVIFKTEIPIKWKTDTVYYRN